MRNVGLGLCVILLLAGGATAQEGYDLSWWSVDGGGQMFSAGGSYALGGTIGQADAGVLSGEGYMLAGGFWPGAGGLYRVYLPLVVRGWR